MGFDGDLMGLNGDVMGFTFWLLDVWYRWPIEFDDLPMRNRDFSVCYVQWPEYRQMLKALPMV